MYSIDYIQPGHIDRVWRLSKAHIQSALRHSEELSIQDVRKAIENSRMGLLVVKNDGKIVTSVVVETVNYPQLIALRVIALGGEKMHDWIPALNQYLSMWGREMGASRIELMGRRGWAKALSSVGYVEKYTFITKDI